MLNQLQQTNTPPPHQTTRLSASHISHRERDDAYRGTIVQFSPSWRLILCKDQIQWIIQRKEKSRRGDWRSFKYLTSKIGIVATCGRLGLLNDPSTAAALYTLPAHLSHLAKK